MLDTQRASFSTAMLVIEFHGMITISLRGEKVVFGEHCLQNDHVRWKMPLNEIATFPTKPNTHTPTLARTMHYLRTCTCTKLEVSRTETDWIFQFITLLEKLVELAPQTGTRDSRARKALLDVLTKRGCRRVSLWQGEKRTEFYSA